MLLLGWKKEVMETKLALISPEKDIFEGLIKMRDLNISHLPVVDGKRLLGLLTIKDILKIENVELSDEEANRVALVSPQATINIIANGNVVKKFNAEAPTVVEGILKCSNPNCISNQNEPVSSEFHIGPDEAHRYICTYCEREIIDLARQIRR